MKPIIYTKDVLGNDFESFTINQKPDYEGVVNCTLIRKLTSNQSKKAILYVHGFNDYFFQEDIANNFVKNGYNFYAVDLRKYGRSHLPHQIFNNVRSLTEYFQDIEVCLDIIKAEENEKIILGGHSTGGLTITLYANSNLGKEKFDALFCNSPFYGMNLSWFDKSIKVPVGAFFGQFLPNIVSPSIPTELYGYSLHKDKFGEWNFNLKWKPFKIQNVNLGWIKAIHNGHLKIKKGIIVGKPILVMHADKSIYTKKWSDEMFTGDAVLSVSDIKEKASRIKGNCTIIEIENGLHDLTLSKKEARDKVHISLFDWLKSNLD